MSDVKPTSSSPFDVIRQTDSNGNEFWSARDLMPILGYDKWQRFSDALDRAKISATNQGFDVHEFLPTSVRIARGRVVQPKMFASLVTPATSWR